MKTFYDAIATTLVTVTCAVATASTVFVVLAGVV